MRLILLELKRILKTRSTWIAVGAALLLSLVIAFSVISYATFSYADEKGEKAQITGRAAIAARQQQSQTIAGPVTPERIAAAFGTYQEVYAQYGEEMPTQIYLEKVYPLEPILQPVSSVFVDKNTGTNRPLKDISPQEAAASFYELRTESLTGYLAYKYEGEAAVREKALAINDTVETPFTYIYGYGSDAADNLSMLLFLIAFICIVIAAPIFASEYQTGADDILRCTKNGRGKLALAKMASALIITAACYLLCVAAFVLIVNGAYGWDSLATSQQMAWQVMSFIPFTLGEVQGLTVAAGLLSFLAVIAFTLFLSTKCKTPVTALLFAMVVCLAPTILYYIGSGPIIDWLRLILPSGGLGLANNFYYELCAGFNFLRIGPYWLWSPPIVLTAAGIGFLLFFCLAVRSYCRHELSA